MSWSVGQARQRLCELLRESPREPQLVYSRNRLVAAVISAELFEEFDPWPTERRRRTQGQTFSEPRAIRREEEYVLRLGRRRP